jgi:Uma2 family endonuclease
MSTLAKTFLTPEEYLEIERKADFKSEYFQGEMFAMAGATASHNLVSTNVSRELSQQLRKRSCLTFSNDMRVRVSPGGLYTYPDVIVVCGDPQYLDDRKDNLVNPTVIVEVLSESTERYDRGRKFEHYRGIESLREYLLISTDRISAELFTRQADGRWVLTAANRAADVIELASIDCRLALADVYEKVELIPAPLRQ